MRDITDWGVGEGVGRNKAERRDILEVVDAVFDALELDTLDATGASEFIDAIVCLFVEVRLKYGARNRSLIDNECMVKIKSME